MGDAAIEPNIENIADLFVILGFMVSAEKILRVGIKPCIGTIGFYRLYNPCIHRIIAQRFTGIFIDKNRQRHAPARWRETTQSGRFSIMEKIRLRPLGGYQLTFVDFFQRRFAQAVCLHRDEPLRRVAEYERRLGAPAMGILMTQFAFGEQAVGLNQRADNRAIGIAVFAFIIKHALAGKDRHAVEINAAFIDGERHFNIVLYAQFKVIFAVAGRNMHQPGAGFIGDEITGQHRHIKIIALSGQRVMAGQPPGLISPTR